jgi:hypothetical protein
MPVMRPFNVYGDDVNPTAEEIDPAVGTADISYTLSYDVVNCIIAVELSITVFETSVGREGYVVILKLLISETVFVNTEIKSKL